MTTHLYIISRILPNRLIAPNCLRLKYPKNREMYEIAVVLVGLLEHDETIGD